MAARREEKNEILGYASSDFYKLRSCNPYETLKSVQLYFLLILHMEGKTIHFKIV